MASNVKPHQRAFALTIALVFLITTVATSVFVVWAIIDENKNKNSQTDTTASSTSSETALDQDVCGGAVTGKEQLPAPEAYKPSRDVTELEKTTLQQGNGQEVRNGDCIVAKYYGTLATNGEMFDENFTSDSAFSFEVGTGQVIKGWDEGLVGAKVGETRRLVIPSDKAYGEQGQSSIPPNADLVFVVKVFEIKE